MDQKTWMKVFLKQLVLVWAKTFGVRCELHLWNKNFPGRSSNIASSNAVSNQCVILFYTVSQKSHSFYSEIQYFHHLWMCTFLDGLLLSKIADLNFNTHIYSMLWELSLEWLGANTIFHTSYKISGLIKKYLKIEHGRVITSHCLTWVQLHVNIEIWVLAQIISVRKWALRRVTHGY